MKDWLYLVLFLVIAFPLLFFFDALKLGAYLLIAIFFFLVIFPSSPGPEAHGG